MPKMRRPVEFWLEQIVFMSERIAGHLDSMRRDEFLQDDRTIDAVTWCISCIGEASGKILESNPMIEKQFEGLQLTAAYAARNRYVHGYFALDVEQVWSTAAVSVPELAHVARRVLASSG